MLYRRLFAGNVTSNRYRVGDKDYDIRVLLQQENRARLEDVANLRVPTKFGKSGPIGRCGKCALFFRTNRN